jgi:transcriptional regulator of met regulon
MVAVITVKSRAEVRKTIRVTVALRLRESLDDERTRRVRRTSLGDGVEFIGRSSRR